MSRVRRLTKEEVDIYDVVDPKLAARVRVVDIPFIPGGYSGITLGPFVCLADPQPTTGTSTLLAHELVHVQQWHDQGLAGFSWSYLRSFVVGMRNHRSWRKAYWDIPHEIEARANAEHWAIRQNRA